MERGKREDGRVSRDGWRGKMEDGRGERREKAEEERKGKEEVKKKEGSQLFTLVGSMFRWLGFAFIHFPQPPQKLI